MTGHVGVLGGHIVPMTYIPIKISLNNNVLVSVCVFLMK